MTETIYGRHPVQEVLRAGRREVQRVLLASDGGQLAGIVELAQAARVPIERVGADRLQAVSDHHQGVVALVGPYPYAELAEVAGSSDDPRRIVLLLDQVQDPQNLGTLLRTAEAVGVSGVILPLAAAAGVTPAVVSASSGACEHLRIARANLAQAIRRLKEQELWVAGLENSPEAQRIDQVKLEPPVALVVGSEGAGLRRLVRESCDFLVRIPMRGAVGSLNAAVAGSVALYEVWRRIHFAADGQ